MTLNAFMKALGRYAEEETDEKPSEEAPDAMMIEVEGEPEEDHDTVDSDDDLTQLFSDLGRPREDAEEEPEDTEFLAQKKAIMDDSDDDVDFKIDQLRRKYPDAYDDIFGE